MSSCDRIEDVRDYAFEELPATARSSVEQHLATCPHCAAELDTLRLTTAALRILPDQEIPQRIAFVSDKVFQPSGPARWFSALWNSAPKLGFASACVLAVGLIVSAYGRPQAAKPAPAPKVDVSAQVNEAVAKAVSQQIGQISAQIRAEDARVMQAALTESERKQKDDRRAIFAAMEESFNMLQNRLGTNLTLASSDLSRSGVGQ
jgi:anti-sigma-K factor RskA